MTAQRDLWRRKGQKRTIPGGRGGIYDKRTFLNSQLSSSNLLPLRTCSSICVCILLLLLLLGAIVSTWQDPRQFEGDGNSKIGIITYHRPYLQHLEYQNTMRPLVECCVCQSQESSGRGSDGSNRSDPQLFWFDDGPGRLE
jgi:hypothetical protein